MDIKSLLHLINKDLTSGSIQVRMAENDAEIDAAQALRYRVFYEECGAKPDAETLKRKRDFDSMDAFCDHLLVIDTKLPEDKKVVGTYRLIRREHAKAHGAFYSQSEYDISPIIAYKGEILELGRSCIDQNYRTGMVMNILWKGLAAYMFRHNIKLMFGCASLHGTNQKEHEIALSYLYHYHLAPPALRAKALPNLYTEMNILPVESFDPEKAENSITFNNIKLDKNAGQNSLPPLIKGYLRVGCTIGDGAVIDEQFNTTDVLIIFKTELITERYMRHYEKIEKRMNN